MLIYLTVERGAIGSASTNHSSGDTARLFSGNIILWIVQFILQNLQEEQIILKKHQQILDPERSTFNGRVYLKTKLRN